MPQAFPHAGRPGFPALRWTSYKCGRRCGRGCGWPGLYASTAEYLPAFLWQNVRMNADNAACSLSADSQYVELAVEVFAMLADATRVRIILALRDGEMAVGALADVVGKSPAAVSQHLAKMRLARMVSTRQEGTKVLYRLANEHARQLVVDAVFQAEHALGGEPAHHRRDRKAAS